MVFSLIAITQRFQEGADGTSINTNHLAYTWRVKMKMGREYKRKREAMRERDREVKRKTL